MGLRLLFFLYFFYPPASSFYCFSHRNPMVVKIDHPFKLINTLLPINRKKTYFKITLKNYKLESFSLNLWGPKARFCRYQLRRWRWIGKVCQRPCAWGSKWRVLCQLGGTWSPVRELWVSWSSLGFLSCGCCGLRWRDAWKKSMRFWVSHFDSHLHSHIRITLSKYNKQEKKK